MRKLRFAIIGSGWRACFYIRIAKALPERFELLGMAVRRRERAEEMQEQYGIRTEEDQEVLLAEKPDFVVAAVNRAANYQVCRELLERGFAVLADTPPSDDPEELRILWDLVCQKGGKLQVAEQYFLYPSYAARIRISRSGILGDIWNVNISALHEYHAFSIIRKFLNNGHCPVKITARAYRYPVAETDSRDGMILHGEQKTQERVRAELEFEDGKTAFYDFSGVQYHSFIRSRHLNVQGTRGEIDDQMISYLEEDSHPHQEYILCERAEDKKGVHRVLFGGRAVYENPYPIGLLTEDETAVACLMESMDYYLETGEELYPLADAMEDAYLTALLNEAVKTGKTVASTPQPWNNLTENL